VVTEYDDAKAIVSGYEVGGLTQGRFLSEWPRLKDSQDAKRLWLWGIIDASRDKEGDQERDLYWLGYFSSGDVQSISPSPDSHADSTGMGGSFEPTIGTSSHVLANRIWELAFADSILVDKRQVAAP